MKKFANSIKIGDILSIPELQNLEYKVTGMCSKDEFTQFNVKNILDDSDIRHIYILSGLLDSTEVEVKTEAE